MSEAEAMHDSSSNGTEDVLPPAYRAPRTLIDLPNEILERIFEFAALDGNNKIDVAWHDNGPPQIHGIIDVFAGPRVSAPRWRLNWVPTLRLTCRSLERIATPAITAHTILVIQRTGSLTDRLFGLASSLVVRRCCFAFMVPHIRQVNIIDTRATQDLLPIGDIDVSGLPQLQSLVFGGFDMAQALCNVFLSLRQQPLAKPDYNRAYARYISKRVLRINSFDEEQAEIRLAWEMARGNPLEVAQDLLKRLGAEIKGEHFYTDLLLALARHFITIDRARVRGLLPRTCLTLVASDEASGLMTAVMDFKAQGGEEFGRWVGNCNTHKETSFLARLADAQDVDDNYLRIHAASVSWTAIRA